MAVTALLAPKVLIGGLNWTSVANQVDWGVEVATKDVTTFDFVPFSNKVAGLKTLSFTTGTFQDYAVGSLDEWLRSNVGVSQVSSLAYQGDAVANTVVVGNGLIAGYRAVNAQVGEVPTNQGVIQGGVIAEGQVTQSATTTVTATGNSTPVNIGAVAAGKSVYAAIHVVSVTGTTPSLTCQMASSTTSGGAYTARGSAGAALTAIGGQWLAAAGPFTDTWWRLNYTVSGTTPVFTVFASLAII